MCSKVRTPLSPTTVLPATKATIPTLPIPAPLAIRPIINRPASQAIRSYNYLLTAHPATRNKLGVRLLLIMQHFIPSQEHMRPSRPIVLLAILATPKIRPNHVPAATCPATMPPSIQIIQNSEYLPTAHPATPLNPVGHPPLFPYTMTSMYWMAHTQPSKTIATHVTKATIPTLPIPAPLAIPPITTRPPTPITERLTFLKIASSATPPAPVGHPPLFHSMSSTIRFWENTQK